MAADADTKAEAVAAARRGIPHAQIAVAAGVQPRTIGRWVKEAEAAPSGPAPIAPDPVESEPDTEPVPVPELQGDTLDIMRQMLANTLAQAKSAESDGNHTAAQRSMASAAALANTIARLEKNVADNADELKISRAEIDDARETVRERLKALADRDILCAACSKKLSISYGEPKDKSK